MLRIQGDDHAFAEYIREEVLSALSEEQVDWLMRCSILDELSGPICDAVLARSGSALVLLCGAFGEDAAARSGGRRPSSLSVASTLPRECLRGELRRLAADARAPASSARELPPAYYAEHGMRDAAVAHACEARDAERAGALLNPRRSSRISRAVGPSSCSRG